MGIFFYCDSAGDPPNKYINKCIKLFRTFFKNKYNKDINYRYNNKEYQQDKTECGIYSCNFLIRILSGEKFDDIISNPLGFKEINSCRNAYFINKPTKSKINDKCDPVIKNNTT